MNKEQFDSIQKPGISTGLQRTLVLCVGVEGIIMGSVALVPEIILAATHNQIDLRPIRGVIFFSTCCVPNAIGAAVIVGVFSHLDRSAPQSK